MNATATDQDPTTETLELRDQYPSISLVLPAYNEAATIQQAVDEAVAALSELTHDFEVLVVDDGSTDATAELVNQAAGKLPQVRLLRQPQNLGYGAALRRGFSEATKQLVGFTDADCQFDLTELDRLVMLARDYDIVTGYRIDRQDPWLRRMYSAGYNVLVRNLLGTRVRDCDCALKLFHREVLAQLPITTDGFLINAEMLSQARQLDLSIVEVGVSHRPRAGGVSKVSVLEIPVVFATLARYWWNKMMFPATFADDRADQTTWPTRKFALMTLLLTVIASTLLFTNLMYALIEPDETRYAQIALEMVHSGDWLVPRLHGKAYLDKPPLLYWLTASSYSLFGENQMSARLPCAVASLLTVLATFLLGWRLVGMRSAWIGALMLSLTGGFVLAGRFLLMDSLLSLFSTVGLLCALRAIYEPRRALFWWLVTGVACGLGVMTKGPVAPVLCFPPIVALAWLTRNYSMFRLRNLLAVTVPTMLISAPWFWQVAASQSEFIGYFFWKHNIHRFVTGLNHAQPWWFYLPVLALGMLPSTFFVPAMVVFLGRKNAEACQARTQELGALLLSSAWIVGFFSLSRCKLPTYILPAMPLLSLSLGKMLGDCRWSSIPSQANVLIEEYSSRAARQLVLGCTVLALVLLIAHVVVTPNAIWLALVIGLVPLVGCVLLWKNQLTSDRRLVAATVGMSLLVTIIGYCRVVPECANLRSVPQSAVRLQAELNGSTPIVLFGQPPEVTSFSIQTATVEFSRDQSAQFKKFMAEHLEAVVVADRAELKELGEICSDGIQLSAPKSNDRVYVATWRAGSIVARPRRSAQRDPIVPIYK
ncbi:glycosyltransferase [Bythopirellula goksoeyrii]|uniref:Undecaprenyl phosphate-alpha-4-amino-4-deoxy-L-arabinose arabinosyl transferase n=1 Tax=Bythopirellula goksoeyrii TaxID=1400387 RepID=A0A5B9QDW4_9BACT|nr:glycosyltransferase [Bythopirellula goksoeyrii]QEG37267.1 Undecaprenyl phosphate-alpha-4-amino-4-deoxy-L-arabinose arabinosyl transferase [Bythopirellula goksoeyrii]